MGSANSTVGTKIVSTNESEKSARNVLDVLAEDVKKQAENAAERYERFLKGKLSKAKFYQRLLKETDYVWSVLNNPCDLDHTWYTNIDDGSPARRNPCDGRNQKRFDENEGFECSKSRIKGNENNRNGGSCAPPRRRHICDKNLEAINKSNTQTVHDLLGNVLVTAKYEGDYLVKNHPQRETSDICIALARSFADIGDIIRGKDLFLGGPSQEKKKLEENLKKIFENIKDNNKDLKDLSIDQVREYWWALNRNDVWKALTCSAPYGANYYRKYSNRTMDFTSQGQCGHKETERDLPTNLDYVPQFLRWLNEWSEEFCRIKNIKIGNIKKSCTGESNNKHCSREGYDCNKTNLRLNEIFMDLECPRCADDCKSYETWVENKKKEFNKQKKKYEKEMDDTEKPDNKENGIYNKTFYDKLKSSYKPVNSFFELLNKGPICQNIDKTIPTDYKDTHNTFSRAEHCKSCPMLGITCKGGQCKSINDITCPKIQNILNISTYKIEKPIDINMLVNNNKTKELSPDLKIDFNDCDLFKKLEEQKWNCEYKCNLDVCELQNFNKEIDDEKVMLIGVLIKRWFVYFLTDYSKIKENLNRCMNNEENKILCITGCYKNCECVGKWIKKKEGEWTNIKDRYLKRYIVKNEDISDDLKTFLKQELFTNYVKSALDKDEKLDNMKGSDGCNELNKPNRTPCKRNDVITILLNRLKEKIKTCKTQDDENKNNNSCKTLPPPPRPRRRRRFRRQGVRRVPRARQGGEREQVIVVGGGRRGRGLLVGEAEVKDKGDEEGDGAEDTAVDETEVVEETVAEVTETTAAEGPKEEAEGPKEEAEGPKVEVETAKRPPQDEVNVCDIVDDILKKKLPTDDIDGCKRKENYQPWNCDEKDTLINIEHKGACMPPRRQKLCLYFVADPKETEKIKKQDDLTDAFIKTAAAETFLAWYYYKNKNGNAQQQLEVGKIPPEFLRSMFYTYADYRDICLDEDISKKVLYVRQAKDKIDKIFPNGKEDYEKRKEFWETNGKAIWKGMLCGLSHASGNTETVQKTLTTNANYKYETVKFSGDNTTTLEKFAERPQFLRWFIEWSDEFCAQREEKEKTVVNGCINAKEYDGCDKHNTKVNGSCVSACNKYKEYITGKQTQYETQKKKFDAVKSGGEQEYNDISSKEAPKYLKENCLFGSCSCMDKVNEIPNYWTNPHKTYDDDKLGIKCQCPPPPCEIVDATLGIKSSMGYVEGCKTKYMTLGLEGWDCGKGGDKKDEGGEDGDVCIPPRRKRLYVKDLQDLTEEKSPLDLRDAFIKSAAVETFFAWHEFKKEKEKEAQERQVLVGAISDPEHPQNKLKEGKIPEDFLRQMFYTFGDYRDIFFKKDIGRDMEIVKKNINKVFENGKSKTSSAKTTPKDWWKKYGPDIWEGMLCALSYNTESKIKDESLCKILTEKNSGNKNTYDKVKISSVPSGDTTLEKFSERPTFFRWLEEWAHEFCTKRTYKLKMIKEDCGAGNNNKNCDDDGFDCDKMCPNKNGSFETFYCLSCAKSCRFYKKWINTKKSEFEKQQSKYHNKISDSKINVDNIYDKSFVEDISKKYDSINVFLKKLKDEPYYKDDSEDIIIDFSNIKETFKHAEYCAPCTTIGVKCKNVDCNDVTDNTCDKTTVQIKQDIQNNKNPIEVHMIVNDSSSNKFEGDLQNDCQHAGIFTGIKEKKWLCGYMCDLDICKPITSDNKKVNKQNILIRALFKQWLENFLEDYNKINNKISHCMKNGEGSTCKNDCRDKCKCVDKWITKKKDEWKNVRDRYIKQYSDKNSEVLYEVKSFLQGGPFYSDIQKAIKPCKDLNEFEDLSECTDTTNSGNATSRKKDVVECLLDKLQKEINGYQNQHTGTDETSCSEASPIPPNTLDIPPDIAPIFCNMPPNPCSDKNDTNIVSVTDVAQEIQKEVKNRMLERSVKEGDKGKSGKKDDSVLKGDIKNAKFRNGRSGNELEGKQICNINTSHSNDKRGSSKDPCEGKDGGKTMFEVKNGWNSGQKVKTSNDLFLPPRREHFCTSNLENLNTAYEGLSDSKHASHSLLGDVLLAAKKVAGFIKERYSDKIKAEGFSDYGTICRAIKYSFADIGDIIKGTDLWDKNDGEITTQNKLVQVFEKIKEELGDKYIGDEAKSPYKQLRKDWWEANREEVWKAMQCQTPLPRGSPIKCSDTPPLVDYIPQRLRWMIEWVEWYCKVQSQAYEELEKKCRNCRSGICDNGKDGCENCTKACKDYNSKIEPWREQWKKIKNKYEQLYEKAESDRTTYGMGDSKDEKDVVAFLSKLHEKNKENNNIYSTAAGYVHEELPNMECKEQTEFCNSSGRDKKNYAFEDYPKNYKERCNCTNAQDQKPTETTQKKACEIVKEILEGKDGKSKIDGCNPKPVKPYPKWDCDKNESYVKNRGACIPPRRQKFCVSLLAKQGIFKNKGEDIRETFVKSAALETYFAWERYKKINANAKSELEIGKIPDEFLRSMKYSFGDFKDIFFGTDITSHNYILDVSKNAKERLISEIGKQKTSDTENDGSKLLEKWWNSNAKDIWDGMLCALSFDEGSKKFKKEIRQKIESTYSYEKLTKNNGDTPMTLEKFATTSQFLRWLTEWGEDFCKERKTQLGILTTGCKNCIFKDGACNRDDNGCKKCTKECETYQGWLEKWKENYNKQKDKFLRDKSENNYDHDPVAKNSEDAREYLEKTLQKFCQNGSTNENCDYKCMNEVSKKSSSDGNRETIPASLEYPPIEIEERCTCKNPPPPLPPPPPVQPPAPPKKTPGDGGVGRTLGPRGPDSDDDFEDEDDEGDDVDNVEETQEEGEEEDDDDDDDDDDDEDDEEEEEDGESEPESKEVGPSATPVPAGPSATPAPLPPLPSDNTSDILKTTIPFGIALALTSIALLFLK
ncbi:hypothetical protein PFMALIP_04092, partial [Plasmodium falciparum MaliPS096_E11]